MLAVLLQSPLSIVAIWPLAGEGEVLRKENTMKPSSKDQAEGTYHKVKGKIKEVAGKLSDNPKLEAEGKVEKAVGKVQEKIGRIKKALGKS